MKQVLKVKCFENVALKFVTSRFPFCLLPVDPFEFFQLLLFFLVSSHEGCSRKDEWCVWVHDDAMGYLIAGAVQTKRERKGER